MLHAASKVPPLLHVSVPPDTSGVEVGLHREGKRIATLYNNVVCVVGLYSLDMIAVRSDLLEHFWLAIYIFFLEIPVDVCAGQAWCYVGRREHWEIADHERGRYGTEIEFHNVCMTATEAGLPSSPLVWSAEYSNTHVEQVGRRWYRGGGTWVHNKARAACYLEVFCIQSFEAFRLLFSCYVNRKCVSGTGTGTSSMPTCSKDVGHGCSVTIAFQSWAIKIVPNAPLFTFIWTQKLLPTIIFLWIWILMKYSERNL